MRLARYSDLVALRRALDAAPSGPADVLGGALHAGRTSGHPVSVTPALDIQPRADARQVTR